MIMAINAYFVIFGRLTMVKPLHEKICMVFRDLRLTDSLTARNRVGCTCLSLHCYLNTMLSRVHLALHARIQDFRQGGPGQSDKKKALTFSFLVLSLFY